MDRDPACLRYPGGGGHGGDVRPASRRAGYHMALSLDGDGAVSSAGDQCGRQSASRKPPE